MVRRSILVVAVVRLRRLAGVLRLCRTRLGELELELRLSSGNEIVHGRDRARQRRPLHLGQGAFLVGDVLIESRVRAALELRRLLAEVFEGDVVALVGGANGGSGVEGAGGGLGDMAGRRLQRNRQGARRGQADRSQWALRRLGGVGDDPTGQREADDHAQQPARHADTHLNCLVHSLLSPPRRNISAYVTSPRARRSWRAIHSCAQALRSPYVALRSFSYVSLRTGSADPRVPRVGADDDGDGAIVD